MESGPNHARLDATAPGGPGQRCTGGGRPVAGVGALVGAGGGLAAEEGAQEPQEQAGDRKRCAGEDHLLRALPNGAEFRLGHRARRRERRGRQHLLPRRRCRRRCEGRLRADRPRHGAAAARRHRGDPRRGVPQRLRVVYAPAAQPGGAAPGCVAGVEWQAVRRGGGVRGPQLGGGRRVRVRRRRRHGEPGRVTGARARRAPGQLPEPLAAALARAQPRGGDPRGDANEHEQRRALRRARPHPRGLDRGDPRRGGSGPPHGLWPPSSCVDATG
mmetsp:Transcript_61745/g.159282  ORF Transcript_61745/g.159282 Transcript_61745/m.159282 type:complete len:273 (+) Transcript_61745:420-1238(+)